MSSPLSDPVAFRVPVDVLQEMDQVAAILDRKRSWVIVRALRNYLAGEGKHLLELAAARQEAATGELTDGNALIEELLKEPLKHTAARR